jgi:hypothetical protein
MRQTLIRPGREPGIFRIQIYNVTATPAYTIAVDIWVIGYVIDLTVLFVSECQHIKQQIKLGIN